MSDPPPGEGRKVWLPFVALAAVAAVISQITVLSAAVRYFLDAPERHRATIAEALTSIRIVKDQPYSDARRRALMLLDANCESATGLNLEHAELAEIDLRPCSTVDFQPFGTWPPTRYAKHPFDLSHAWMSHADLRAAHLDEANLIDADLKGADLRGAHLRGARMDRADLTEAKLQGADLREAQMPDAKLINADLDLADLTNADLTRAHLNNASLLRSNLAYAELSHTELNNAKLVGANLCSAQLYNTSVSGANLTHANLNGTMILRTRDTDEGMVQNAIAESARSPANAQPPHFRLALLVTSPNDTFFTDVKTGVESYLNESTSLYADPCAPQSPHPVVQLTVSPPTYDKFDKEQQEVEKLIRENVDAILLPQVDDKGFPNLIKQAYEAGIVVVCYDSCGGGEELDQYFSGRFRSDQTALGRRSGEYLVDLLKSRGPDETLRLGILHCGTSFENCNERARGFLSALTNAGVRWQLKGFLEGWRDDSAPAAARRLLDDNPTINVLWAANGLGTEALASAAASVSQEIIILGTDTTPKLLRLLSQDARNPLRAVIGQNPRTMGECGAAAALAALGWKGRDAISKRCPQPSPIELYAHK
jgi:ABC-type sugar transport system substrate-binding protein